MLPNWFIVSHNNLSSDLSSDPIITLQLYKMIKQTQTLHRLLLMNCLRVFDHFVGVALKRIKLGWKKRLAEHWLLTFKYKNP